MGTPTDEEPEEKGVRGCGGPGPRLRGRLKAKLVVGTHVGSNIWLGRM